MTKEELIGRKFISMPNTPWAQEYTFIQNYDTGELGIGVGNSRYFNDYNLEYVNNTLVNGTWKLLPEDNKMYKTPKGIEYGIGTQFILSSSKNEQLKYNIKRIEEDIIHYKLEELDKEGAVPIKLSKNFFEEKLDKRHWHVITPIPDYKQVDPKTITFDFTNTKIKVNNEEESKWIQEVAFANEVYWYASSTPLHIEHKALYFNKGQYIQSSPEANEYFRMSSNKEITIQDILNNMKEVIEVGDVVKVKGYPNATHYVVDKVDNNKVLLNGLKVYDNLHDLELVSKGKKKEIIGYETVVDLPGIPKGTKSTTDNTANGFIGIKNNSGIGAPNYVFNKQQYEDTKFFKPIYKQDAIEIKFSKYTATLSKESGLVFSDGEKMTLGGVKQILTELDKPLIQVDKFKVIVIPEHVQVGCKLFTLKDVQAVKEAIKKLES